MEPDVLVPFRKRLIFGGQMNYYSAWTISSVAKLVTEALKKTGSAGVYILVGGVTLGGYMGYKKIRELEDRVAQLEFKSKFGR